MRTLVDVAGVGLLSRLRALLLLAACCCGLLAGLFLLSGCWGLAGWSLASGGRGLKCECQF